MILSDAQFITMNNIKSIIDDILMPIVCINKKNLKTFEYLVNERSEYWSYKKLILIFYNCLFFKWKEGL